MKTKITALITVFIVCLTVSLAAQDVNIEYSIDKIEQFLNDDSLSIVVPRAIRFKGDKAKTAVITRPNGFFMRVKLKCAPSGGMETNNQPRYEVATYKLQKFFLDEGDYVVPPTVIRAFPTDILQKFDPKAEPTFGDMEESICGIQYWLNSVTSDNILENKRLKVDSLYAKNFANMNILTFIIKHSDSNKGNVLISSDPQNPRLFVVDNGLAFGDTYSQRGYRWRKLHVDKVPKKSIDRLRQVTHEDLERQLLVVTQFKIVDGTFKKVEPTEPHNRHVGVTKRDDIVQFGLTEKEIDLVYDKIQDLLWMIDHDRLETF
ncbi:hypothetical protein GF407_12175 [candidate division KSB1 bacterium]|nr:hypothetical protein [candidate division KSB1 bacterium]